MDLIVEEKLGAWQRMWLESQHVWSGMLGIRWDGDWVYTVWSQNLTITHGFELPGGFGHIVLRGSKQRKGGNFQHIQRVQTNLVWMFQMS